MSGVRITQRQEKLYMKTRQQGSSQVVAAVRTGISERSGRRIEKGERSSREEPRHWRTRPDPLEAVWEKELVPLLERAPDLTGLTLWEYLDETRPGEYSERALRTLQRRVKQWRAVEGPARDVIFRQSVPPGYQGLSDFSHPSSPITLQGKAFQHLLYQFRLAYSGWRYVQVVLGGESYAALADGLQNALQRAGGCPVTHRTDSLSAAYVNTAEQSALTRAYAALCAHYRMKPTRNNAGVSHENGAIECAHGSFKRRLDQALKLRGNCDFHSRDDYRRFLDRVTDRLNRRCRARFEEERKTLQALPGHRFTDYTQLHVRVTRMSTIEVKKVLYTVPSSLIGEALEIHLYHDRLQGFVGQKRVFSLARVYPKPGQDRTRRVDYRHVIHALAAKPQAFRFAQLRDDLLPTEGYRRLWQLVDQQLEPREACKWIVGVLRLACDYDCEERLATDLLRQAERGPLPPLKTLQERYLRSGKPPLTVTSQHALNDYDHLLKGQWALSQGDRP